MAVKLPDGTLFALATNTAAAVTMTALSNAEEAVPTLSGTPNLNPGDVVVVQSGWSGINDRVAKLGTGNKLSGFDTRDLQRFPAGGGAGSLAKVDSWVQVSQILSSESSGGEQQFLTYSFLENDFESQIPTQTSPISLTLSIADDDTLPGFLALKAASDAREQRVLRATLPGGSTLYYHAYVSLNETPSTTKGQLMAVSATFSLVSRFTRYSA